MRIALRPLSLAFLLAVASGCVHDSGHVPASTKITGRVIRHSVAHPVSGVAVEVFDAGSHFSPFGIAAPPSLGTAITDKHGFFAVVAAGVYRREQIGVEFRGRPNLEAMEQGLRVVDVAVTPTGLTTRSSERAGR